jgi:YD repeat-containing protein
MTYADGTAESMQYDALGRQVDKTDAIGRVTRFGYDVLGRLISVTDALGQITSYGYDEVGNRVSPASPSAAMLASLLYVDQRGGIVRSIVGAQRHEQRPPPRHV